MCTTALCMMDYSENNAYDFKNQIAQLSTPISPLLAVCRISSKSKFSWMPLNCSTQGCSKVSILHRPLSEGKFNRQMDELSFLIRKN